MAFCYVYIFTGVGTRVTVAVAVVLALFDCVTSEIILQPKAISLQSSVLQGTGSPALSASGRCSHPPTSSGQTAQGRPARQHTLDTGRHHTVRQRLHRQLIYPRFLAFQSKNRRNQGQIPHVIAFFNQKAGIVEELPVPEQGLCEPRYNIQHFQYEIEDFQYKIQTFQY